MAAIIWDLPGNGGCWLKSNAKICCSSIVISAEKCKFTTEISAE